ncbi:MAG: LytR/AlgR family response regulator transcription factor [Thermonemataceae bacterium]
MLSAIIIDDEARARRILEKLLEEYCPQVQVVAQADDAPQGLKAIKKYQPDVVLLDIEMPNYSGFQLLDFVEEVTFEIIFTTAYQEYAIKAFQVSAIDYLLKPIQIDLLIKAIEKVEKQARSQINKRLQTLQANLDQATINRLALPVAEGLVFIDVNEILYLKAEGAYTKFVLLHEEPILVSKNIKSFVNILDPQMFYRTHRSFYINLYQVKQYVRQDGGYIIMNNNDIVNLSKDKKDAFLKACALPK